MNKAPKNIFITIKLIVVLLLSSLIFGFVVQTSREIPPNAILYVADYKKIYFVPLCLESCAIE
jgi:hypothetical protein